jgi:hypothetical protein
MTALPAIAIAIATPASAQEPRVPIALSIDVCLAALDASEIRRIVSIELGAELVPIHAATELTTRITASCDSEEIVLRVEDPLTAKATERRVALSAHEPLGRERFIAIAMVELVASSWSELEIRAETAAALPPPPADLRDAALDAVRGVRPPARPYGEPIRLSISAEARSRLLTGGPWALWGGGVRLGLFPVRFLAIRAGVIAEAGEAIIGGGSVGIEAYGGELAVELTAELGSGLELGGGISAHASHGILRGRTTSERAMIGSVEGLFAGAALLGVARLALAALLLELRLEVGHAISRVVGTSDGANVVELGGPWAALVLAIGIRG